MVSRAILESVTKNPYFGGKAFSSRDLFSGSFIGTSSSVTAATTFAVATPFAYRALFGNGPVQFAYCDAGAALDEDFSSGMHSGQIGSSYFGTTLGKDHSKREDGSFFKNEELRYSMKQYDFELKPLLSAFHWKNLGLTTLRSFLLFYLPLLEPRPPKEDEDDDFLIDDSEEQPVDLIEPFKKSVKQIARETTVVTTRRILERLAVHYVSERMAWKLLKDVPKSAIRKAARGMPTCTFCFHVCRTTFRAHLLGVVASWTVQVGLNIYEFCMTKSEKEDSDETDTAEAVKILRKKVYGATVRCVGSLIFASVGAGIGTMLIRPSAGQRIGCVLGDLAGPFIIEFCFKKLHWEI